MEPVLVTTLHRGVFFGYADSPDTLLSEGRGKLYRARNCIYWPTENHGFVGLAVDGPKEGARVGPPADIGLRDIVSVTDCTSAAVDRWESIKWSR